MAELTREECLEQRAKTGERLVGIEKEVGSLKHRMKGVEDITKEIHNISKNSEKMLTEMAAQREDILEQKEDIKEQGHRIKNLEAKPAKNWDLIVQNFIILAMGALVGFLIK